MKRQLDRELEAWSRSADRKVLLLRGARQVGKTYAVHQLAKPDSGKKFTHLLEVNFEEDPRLGTFFEGSLNPIEINQKLSAYFGLPIRPGETLLFFDEIQACPNALRALRFYHEKMPTLHVIAAGSLLEFALSEIPSFGVGRISNLFVYPLSFREFLWALGREELDRLVQEANPNRPMDPLLHQELLEKFRIYQILGGMPAVVSSFATGGDLLSSQKILDGLITTLQDDFAKYKKKAPVSKLMETFRSIPFQTGRKFKYTFIAEGEPTYGYKEALELLIRAGLAYRVYHTAARGLPLGAQIDPKKFKVILFDLGIHQRLLGLDLPTHMLKETYDLIHKGNLAELFVGLELVAYQTSTLRPQLCYWHREARASNAEVDYLLQKGETILPIEVKSGTQGGMKSLFLFLKERGLASGVRVSHENFARLEKIEVVPIYGVSTLF